MNASKTPRQRPSGGQLTPHVEPLLVGNTPPGPAQSQTSEHTNSGTHAATDSGSKTPKPSKKKTDPRPRYQQMTRVEARLRRDQLDALTQLRRAITDKRTDRTERITDNTLIRIAIDLLLTQQHHLTGDTEHQLRNNLLTHLTPKT